MNLKTGNAFSWIWVMLILFVGSLVGGFITPMLPFSEIPWINGIVAGIISFIIIAVIGMTTHKLDFMTIIIGGALVFVGGILGGYISGMIGLEGWFQTALTLFLQTMLLMLTGYVKGRGPKL